MKAILHLNLTRRWFNMIAEGEKREEYRGLTPYWSRVFKESGNIKIKGKYYHPTDVTVWFSNGYAKDRPQFTCDIKSNHVGYGKKEWGANPNKQYHVLTLGEPNLFI